MTNFEEFFILLNASILFSINLYILNNGHEVKPKKPILLSIVFLTLGMFMFNQVAPVTDNPTIRIIFTLSSIFACSKFLLRNSISKSIFDGLMIFIVTIFVEFILSISILYFLNVSASYIQSNFYLQLFLVGGIWIVSSLTLLIFSRRSFFKENCIQFTKVTIINLLLSTIMIIFCETLFFQLVYTGSIREYSNVALIGLLMSSASVLLIIGFLVSYNRTELARIELEKLSLNFGIDQLTSTYNRDYGFEKLKLLVERATSREEILSFCYLDINNLKHVNDTYGHDKGDELLNTVCGYIRLGIRKDDLFIRIGGDEFLVVLFGVKDQMALDILERVNDSLSKVPFVAPLSFAYGVIQSNKESEINIEKLISEADQKMYEMKYKMKNDIMYGR